MELDPELRRLKANAAYRMRREAADLRAQVLALESQAQAVERTWALPQQSAHKTEPDLRTFSAQTGHWE